MSSADITVAVGLFGVLMISSLVRGVMAFCTACQSML